MLSDQIIGISIASLQTGASIGTVKAIIVSANNLDVIAFECEVAESDASRPILTLQDIRQLTHECVIINSIDEITDATDIVRLKNILEENLRLPNIPVYTASGKKLGKVEKYTVNTETMKVQKLYVHPTFLTSLVSGTLTIDRGQIIDVSQKQITVRDSTSEAVIKPMVAMPKISITPE